MTTLTYYTFALTSAVGVMALIWMLKLIFE